MSGEDTVVQKPHAPLWVLLGVMVVAGLGLRLWDLGFPPHLTWDEHHFVENARNYLTGQPDWNDHPPLGKLLMALSMSATGGGPASFRLPSALLGVCSIAWVSLLAGRVSRTALGTALGAALIAVDGFFISYSRVALLDGMLSSVALLSLLLMTSKRLWVVALSGLAIGSAMAIKMSGLVLLGPLAFIAILSLARGRLDDATLFGRALPGPGWASAALVSAGLALSTYTAWWVVGLEIAESRGSVRAAFESTRDMMAHHASLTAWEHPLLSRWYTWAIPTRPITLRTDAAGGGTIRVLSSRGNPVLWWTALVAMGWSLWTGLQLFTKRSSSRTAHAAALPTELGFVWLFVAFLAFLSPWIVTNRDSYIYHYLPAYGIALTGLSAWLGTYTRTPPARTRLLGFVGVVALISSLMAPVSGQLPMSASSPLLRLLGI